MPITAAAMAQISTAPALISFTSRNLSSFSGCTTSDKRSMAELMASAARTSPMAKKTAIHSDIEIWKSKPAMITMIVTAQCIHALCSRRMNTATPLQALAKLDSRALMVKLFFMVPIAINVIFLTRGRDIILGIQRSLALCQKEYGRIDAYIGSPQTSQTGCPCWN